MRWCAEGGGEESWVVRECGRVGYVSRAYLRRQMNQYYCAAYWCRVKGSTERRSTKKRFNRKVFTPAVSG